MSSGGKLLSHTHIFPSSNVTPCKEGDIKIETASWRDMQFIRTIEQEAYPQDAYPFLELLGMLTLPGFVRIKANVNNQLAGFIFAEGFTDSEYDWITAIRVSKAYQRCGIATQLILNGEKHLKKNIIRLCARVSNHPAILLYTKCGYKEVTTWKNYYHDGEDAVVMEKMH